MTNPNNNPKKPEISRLVPLGQGLKARYERAVPPIYVPSGIGPLDEIILGANASEVTMIAGAPGQGKTSLATQWCLNNAEQGMPTAILSLEMGQDSLQDRLVSAIANVDMRKLRSFKWSDEERARAEEAADWLAQRPLFVDQGFGVTTDTVADVIISWKQHDIVLGVVDYVQHLSGRGDNRVTQVGDAIRAIKAAARQINIPILVISSLNRGAATRSTTEPRMSDLRDTADLEYVADTILMLHYPDDDIFRNYRRCNIHVMKQRNGPTGIAMLAFDKRHTRFEEPDPEKIAEEDALEEQQALGEQPPPEEEGNPECN